MDYSRVLSLFEKSFVGNYYCRSVIESQLSTVIVIDNVDEFYRLYGGSKKDIYLEGFNRSNKSYIGPYGTVHTIIHELLHNLSSSFRAGKRMLNGIAFSGDNEFLGFINEGLTEYLAVCISGEAERHYHLGVHFFRKLDEILNEMYGVNNILFDSYICNNTYFLENFINTFCTYKHGKNMVDWEYFSNNFCYFNLDTLNAMFVDIRKNVLKNKKKRLFKRDCKEIDFDKFYELNVVGVIKKAYYELVDLNPEASDEDLKRGLQAMFDGDLQYISNKRGVRGLLQMVMEKYSLIDVVRNNYDKFDDMPIIQSMGFTR